MSAVLDVVAAIYGGSMVLTGLGALFCWRSTRFRRLLLDDRHIG